MASIAPLTKYSMKKDVTLRGHTFKTSLSLGEGGRVIDFKIFWNGGGREFFSCTTSEMKK